MVKPQSVTFIVGGEKFELSRSLLDTYPNTMLSKSASERWQKDPESEIIMDRDPMLFHHVLAYLRDNKVYLPTTVAKKAILSELQYYCVDDVDENAIDDSLTQGFLAARGAKKMQFTIDECDKEFKKTMEEIKKTKSQANSILIAKECIEKFLALRGDQKELEVTTSFTTLQKHSHFYRKICNKILAKVGLQMIKPDENVFRYIISEIDQTKDMHSIK